MNANQIPVALHLTIPVPICLVHTTVLAAIGLLMMQRTNRV